jgi:hypothetical protein
MFLESCSSSKGSADSEPAPFEPGRFWGVPRPRSEALWWAARASWREVNRDGEWRAMAGSWRSAVRIGSPPARGKGVYSEEGGENRLPTCEGRVSVLSNDAVL